MNETLAPTDALPSSRCCSVAQRTQRQNPPGRMLKLWWAQVVAETASTPGGAAAFKERDLVAQEQDFRVFPGCGTA